MKTYVALTDFDWYQYLRALPDLDEVNFWQPSGRTQFRALNPGEPFLFKLHSPRDYIVGGGFFTHSTLLPVSLAWDTFKENNGANSLKGMRNLIEQYRGQTPSNVDYQIGCIILTQPFFFNEDQWISVPPNWSSNIGRGKTYDTAEVYGIGLWEEVQLRLQSNAKLLSEIISDQKNQYGSPIIIMPRLGQGGFRIIVTDAYQRIGAVTQERTLPTLEAAHIKPFKDSGPNDIGNGILFRSDIHRLFDKGYVTISPDYHFEVSKRIKEDFNNGETYYKMHGAKLHLPRKKEFKPKDGFINWHNENVYLG